MSGGWAGAELQTRSPEVGGSDKKIGPGKRTTLLEKEGAYASISTEVNE